MKVCFLYILILITCWCCSDQDQEEFKLPAKAIGQVTAQMTEVMIHDVTNPPLAARFFAYTMLSGYSVISLNNKNFPSLEGRLNGFPSIAEPPVSGLWNRDFAAMYAMMETASKLQPSGNRIELYARRFTDSCKESGIPDEVLANSKKFGVAMAERILAYAKSDRYNRISNFPRYTPRQQEGEWYPTPPAFIAAVEPYFNTIRPLTLDTCNQFRPVAPVLFSPDTASAFFRMMKINADHSLTTEQEDIAAFWDCNPFAVDDRGHLLIGIKKISPGAHWIGITDIACRQAGLSFGKAMQVYTAVSCGLMDGFICCWDEKYRSRRIRPETAIRRYVDHKWKPLLQTPPFPEYPSGHSVISTTSAEILSAFFGDSFSYADTVEQAFGFPARKFPSFRAAAKEAAISRFYGGIHFMDAISEGQVQGKKVARQVLSRLDIPIASKNNLVK